jgi:hypothetical protein
MSPFRGITVSGPLDLEIPMILASPRYGAEALLRLLDYTDRRPPGGLSLCHP